MSSRAHQFDVIIVGSGLSGLLVAASISHNYRVALIESSEFPGGLCRQNTGYKELSGHFHTLPVTADTDGALDYIERLLAKPVRRDLVNESPVTFNEGFSPFVGFGEESPSFVDEFSFYTHPNRYFLHEGPDQWVQDLYTRFTGEFFNLSQVTKIDVDEFGKYSVVMNGQKELHAPKVVFCCNPKLLLGLLPDEKTSTKIRNKLTRAQLWTSVLLQIVHSEVASENLSIHVLNGKTDVKNPCLGQFHSSLVSSDGQKTQTSQWLTFLSEEDAQSEELLGLAIKRMKKQISRAYPDALNNLKYEKISVFPASHGSLNTGNDQMASLVGFENFFVISPSLGESKNIPGLVLQAERCSKALGCHPA